MHQATCDLSDLLALKGFRCDFVTKELDLQERLRVYAPAGYLRIAVGGDITALFCVGSNNVGTEDQALEQL